MTRRATHAAGGLLAALALAACVAAPPVRQAATPPTGMTPAQMVAAIRGAAHGATPSAAGDELVVQPLRDPMVEDLREQAAHLEAAGAYAEAAAALDRALSIVAGDPALIQERAEAAVLLGDYAIAGGLALQAWRQGSKVGPLCRRHWETVHQVRLHDGDLAGARSAVAQRDACTVAGPARY